MSKNDHKFKLLLWNLLFNLEKPSAMLVLNSTKYDACNIKYQLYDYDKRG